MYLTDLLSLLTDFLPTLMIWTFTALLPFLVAYSDRLLGHLTRYRTVPTCRPSLRTSSPPS
jgi:hypothetical protein